MSSTNGPSGCVRMRPPRKFWHIPHMFRGPIGSSSECGVYKDGAHNCMWLGPSPGFFSGTFRRRRRSRIEESARLRPA
eukprot:4683139-Pyramimonas_sp.AAC.1